MKTHIIRIGNSRGVRIPKPLLEQAGLGDEIELRLADGAIVIAPARRPRAGWSEAALAMRSEDDDRLLDAPTDTRFDREEWEWR